MQLAAEILTLSAVLYHLTQCDMMLCCLSRNLEQSECAAEEQPENGALVITLACQTNVVSRRLYDSVCCDTDAASSRIT